MQYKLFNVPIADPEREEASLNVFLRNHSVHHVERAFHAGPMGACWSFCIEYADNKQESVAAEAAPRKEKIDYREILDECTYIKFSRLKEIRKQIALREAIPAYAVFTNEELVSIAKLESISKESLQVLFGLGDKKVEKYADVFCDELKAAGII